MTDMTDTVTAPEPGTGSGARRFSSPLRTAPKPVRELARYAGALPFLAYVFIFLLLPLIWIIRDAFLNSDTGAATFSNVDIAVHGAYLKGFEQSLELSLIASVLPGLLGLWVAYAIFTAKGAAASWLRQVVITASGVFANFGGVPGGVGFLAAVGFRALVAG